MSGECDICGSLEHVESKHKCENCPKWKRRDETSDYGTCLLFRLEVLQTADNNIEYRFFDTHKDDRCRYYPDVEYLEYINVKNIDISDFINVHHPLL